MPSSGKNQVDIPWFSSLASQVQRNCYLFSRGLKLINNKQKSIKDVVVDKSVSVVPINKASPHGSQLNFHHLLQVSSCHLIRQHNNEMVFFFKVAGGAVGPRNSGAARLWHRAHRGMWVPLSVRETFQSWIPRAWPRSWNGLTPPILATSARMGRGTKNNWCCYISTPPSSSSVYI